jgi:hypothetical protein
MKLKTLLIIGFLTALCLPGFTADSNNPNSKQDTADKTLSNIQILTDSTINYPYGNACGFAGTRPLGKQAIVGLLNAKDYKGLKSVLDGHNNEGKVYAIEAALLLANKGEITLSPSDKMKIRSLIMRNFKISECNGCLFGYTNSLDLFRTRYFEKLLHKNNITI